MAEQFMSITEVRKQFPSLSQAVQGDGEGCGGEQDKGAEEALGGLVGRDLGGLSQFLMLELVCVPSGAKEAAEKVGF